MKVIEMTCPLCQCQLYPDDQLFETQWGLVDVLCMQALEKMGRVWD